MTGVVLATPAFADDATGGVRTTPAGATRLNPTGRAITFLAPLKDGDFYLADVEVHIGIDDELLIGASALDALSRILSSSAHAALKAGLQGGEGLTPEDFASAGLALRYDPNTLEVRLGIPAEHRRTTQIAVSNLDPLAAETFAPARVSAFVNARATQDYVHRGGGEGWADPVAAIDGAARAFGVVLEGEALWSPAEAESFQRQGTRFVYDDPDALVRWSVGDLRVTGTRFQSIPSLAGVGAMRAYSLLAPQRNIRPRGERSFTLERASTVETIINGRTVARTRLDPGAYDARDFPFVDGANDVRLVIVDDTGRTETIRFSIFMDRALLAPGLTEFGAYAGIRSELDGAELRYFSDERVLSAFVQHGVSSSLTAGIDLQADSQTRLVGVEAFAATPLGIFGVNVAASGRNEVGSGTAVNAGFTRLVRDDVGAGATSIGVSIEARSKKFVSLDAATPADGYRYEAGFNIARAFGEDSYVAFDTRYAPGWGGRRDAHGVRATVGRRLTPRLELSLDVFDVRGGGDDGTGVRISLARRFGASGSVRADYDSLARRGSVSGQALGGRGADAWNLSAALDRTERDSFVNAAASYYANRGEIGVAHAASFDPGDGNVTDERSALRVGAGLAFADGAIALGRPVHDSFAVFAAHKSLDGKTVRIDPAADGDLARAGALGGALVGDLGAYSMRALSYDAPGAPVGYDLGAGVVQLRPSYRSGYKVVIGSDYALTVVGRLMGASGAPLALQVGRAIEVARAERTPVTVITNRDGRFGLQGLRPGRWRLEMPNARSFVVDIPDDAEGMVRVGDLTAQHEEAAQRPAEASP